MLFSFITNFKTEIHTTRNTTSNISLYWVNQWREKDIRIKKLSKMIAILQIIEHKQLSSSAVLSTSFLVVISIIIDQCSFECQIEAEMPSANRQKKNRL